MSYLATSCGYEAKMLSMYKSPMLQMPFLFQRGKTPSVRPGKKRMIFTYWGVQVGFWSLYVVFYLAPDFYGVANYKTVMKACLSNSSGTVKKSG